MRPGFEAARRRRGSHLVEYAAVLPVLLLLLLGGVVLGAGVSRQQQVAWLAREGARWASVHGLGYSRATGNPPVTPQDVYENAIKPLLAGLDAGSLTYTVTWDPDKEPYRGVKNADGEVVPVSNKVSVTVSYQWLPEAYPAFLGSGRTLTSTSVMAMSY
jgi:Flp pilus assembly protein TadG